MWLKLTQQSQKPTIFGVMKKIIPNGGIPCIPNNKLRLGMVFVGVYLVHGEIATFFTKIGGFQQVQNEAKKHASWVNKLGTSTVTKDILTLSHTMWAFFHQ